MADVKVSFSSDDYKLYRSFQKTMDKMQSASNKASESSSRSAERSGKTWRKNNEESFGSGAQGLVTGYIAGLVGIGGAIQQVKVGFQELNRMRTEFASKQERALLPMASLAQLSGGDPRRMEQLVNWTNQLYKQGGAPSLGESAETIFQTVSAGFQGERQFISQLFPVFNAPGEMLSAVAGLRTGLGTQESLKDIVSRALVVSGGAPSKAEELLTGLAPALGQVGETGAGAGELLGAMAPLSQVMGAPRAGTAIGAFLRQIGKRGEFQGRGLLGSIRDIKSMGFTGSELQKFLGDAQAVSGYRLMAQNIPTIERLIQQQEAGVETRLSERVLATAYSVPEIRAIRSKQAEEAKLEIQERKEGLKENLSQAVIDRKYRYFRNSARGNFLAEIGGAIAHVWRKGIAQVRPETFLGADELRNLPSYYHAPDPENLPEETNRGGGNESNQTLIRIESELKKQNSKNEKPTGDSFLNMSRSENPFGSMQGTDAGRR